MTEASWWELVLNRSPAVLLLLVPLPALGAFVLLGLGPTRLPRPLVRLIGLAGGVLPLVFVTPLAFATLAEGWRPLVPIFTLEVGPSLVDLALRLDPLSAIVALIVSGVGAAVLSYSLDYVAKAGMAELRRFLALMNLFLAAMLAMVLAGDSITLFLGWELMGLCSFFLIASRVTSQRAVAAGRKAFLMTRVADAALLAALLLLFLEAGSVRLDRLMQAGLAAPETRRMVIASLLLVGAAGKSAQFPFHSWLPSAMTGPTPVSALLHSATMVASGAFLLALFFPLLASVPPVLWATALLGIGTSLLGAAQAIAETDVKRLLAWSSVSQIGFMLLAIGMGSPEAAIAHFVIHALFKSLLFLAAGDMARAAGGSTALSALAGMRVRRPVAFFTFAAGAASLAGLPLLSAGFWSKEAVMGATFNAPGAGELFWLAGLVSALLTAAYAIRPVLAGLRPVPAPGSTSASPPPAVGPLTEVPLVLLAVLSVAGGFLVAPIMRALGAQVAHLPLLPLALTVTAPLAGFALAILLLSRPTVAQRLLAFRKRTRRHSVDALLVVGIARPFGRLVRRLSRHGAPVEDPVGRIVPGVLAALRDAFTVPLSGDPIDKGVMALVAPVAPAARAASQRHDGQLRHQTAALALGLLVLLAAGVLAAWA
jgi:NADH-quinone oxidoreductase subunit L